MKKSKIHILKEDMKIHIFFFLRKYSWIGCGFMLARIQKGIQKIAEAGLFALLFFAWYSLENEIPGEINVIAGEEGRLISMFRSRLPWRMRYRMFLTIWHR